MSNNCMPAVGSAILLIVSNVLYHISQKSIPAGMNPLVSIMATFLTALVTCLLFLPVFADIHIIRTPAAKLTWASYLSGISCAGIVLGHVLYYRSGWSLSSGTLFAYTAICIILIPVGLFIFHEKMTLSKIAGIIVSLAGLFLLTRE
jgi:drug/metabolite transporter (DMT)-like permease